MSPWCPALMPSRSNAILPASEKLLLILPTLLVVQYVCFVAVALSSIYQAIFERFMVSVLGLRTS